MCCESIHPSPSPSPPSSGRHSVVPATPSGPPAAAVWRLDGQSPGNVAESASGLCLSFRFRGEVGERVCVVGPEISVDRRCSRLEIQWRGRGAGGAVVWVVDDGGQHHAYGPRPLPGADWQTWRIDLRGRRRAHWGGDDDGILRLPVRRLAWVVWPDPVADHSSADALEAARAGAEAYRSEGRVEIRRLCLLTPAAAIAEEIEDLEGRHRSVLVAGCGLPSAVGAAVAAPLRSGLDALAMLRSSTAESAVDEAASQDTLAALRRRLAELEIWLKHFQACGGGSVASAAGPMADDGRRALVVTFHGADGATARTLSETPPPSLGSAPVNLWTLPGGAAMGRCVVHCLEALRQVEWAPSPLVSKAPDGESLTVTWHPVLPICVDGGDGSFDGPRRLPDALAPAAAIDLEAGARHLFWLRIEVPRGASAGMYRGTLRLRVDGRVCRTFAVHLRVLDVPLPRRSSLITTVGFAKRAVARFYGQRDLAPKVVDRWVDFLARRGLHADPLVGSENWWHRPERPLAPSPTPRLRTQRRRFGWIWGARASNRMLLLDGPERRAAEDHWLRALPAWVEAVEGAGRGAQAYLYTYDEPTAADYPKILPFLAECRRIAPSLRVVLTFYRDDPTVALAPFVDVWCPHVAWVERHPRRVEALRRSGAELWWYLTDDGPPYPSLRLEAPEVYHWIIFWQTYHFGFRGLLLWESCHWHRNVDRRPRWPAGPWMVCHRQGENVAGSGNGSLLYPGPHQRPLGSLRLESLHRGVQDHDLLCLLAQRLRHRDLTAEAADRGRRLLDLSALIRGVTDFEIDARVYGDRRRAIAEFLQQHPVHPDSPGEHHAMRKTVDLRQVRARAAGLGEPLPPP